MELERVHRGGKRFYVGPNGGEYVSVTTVCSRSPQKKKALAKWEDHVGHGRAEKIREESALLGTLVHHRILQEYAVRKLPKPPVDVSNAYGGIIEDIETCEIMWDDLDFPVETTPYVEERIISREHKYAGTFDLMSDGTVVDLKSSSKIYHAHRLQISAYHNAVAEDPDLPDPEGAAIIRLDPDPETNPTLEAHVERLGEAAIENNFDVFCDLLERGG